MPLSRTRWGSPCPFSSARIRTFDASSPRPGLLLINRAWDWDWDLGNPPSVTNSRCHGNVMGIRDLGALQLLSFEPLCVVRIRLEIGSQTLTFEGRAFFSHSPAPPPIHTQLWGRGFNFDAFKFSPSPSQSVSQLIGLSWVDWVIMFGPSGEGGGLGFEPFWRCVREIPF